MAKVKRQPLDQIDVEKFVKSGSPAIRHQATVATVLLDQIHVTEQRTRSLNLEHVQELQESIAMVGLGQPLITDKRSKLIAGGHRLAAIQKLQAEQPETFWRQFPNSMIPVRVYDFDSLAEPDRAQAIEIAENEKRRDYTAAEVKAIAQKYLENGYTHRDGKPKKGERQLMPALASHFRLSRRTIQRYLAKPEQELTRTDVQVSSKARKIKGHIDSLMRVRAFFKQEDLKGSRSIDHLIETLELRLKDEQIDF